MSTSRLIFVVCVCALLAGCGAVQVKTNMPALKNWFEKDEKPEASSAYKRPPAAQPATAAAPLPWPRTAIPAVPVAPIPAPPAKRKAAKKTEAQISAAKPSSVEPPKPSPWAIAPQ